MMWLDDFPPWVSHATTSMIVIGVSYLGGRLLEWLALRRLTAFAARTKGQWDDVIAHELARRVPRWSLLLGCYLATAFWTLPPTVDTAVTKTTREAEHYSVVLDGLTAFELRVVPDIGGGSAYASVKQLRLA